MIKVLLIDDEPLALQQMKQMAEKIPYFEIAGICESAFEAMQLMEQQTVDAIFTDINMPDLSGLDFILSLPTAPITVFTTAYSQYAIDGYRANAIDYLLKPFGMEEFQRVAIKVKQQYDLIKASESSQKAEHAPETSLTENFLYIKNGTRIERILLEEITHVEAQGEYLKLHSENGKSSIMLMGITRMTEILSQRNFVRIHRSFLVNMKFVKEISHSRLKLSNGTELPIGDSYRDLLQLFVNTRRIDC